MRRALSLCAGILLFGVFIYRLDFEGREPGLGSAPSFWIATIVLMNLLVPILKTLRWKLLLAAHGIHRGSRDLFGAVAAGFFLGLVTPGTVGEFGRVLILDLRRMPALATILYEKVFDFLSLFLIVAIALAFEFLDARALMFGGLFTLAMTGGLLVSLKAPSISKSVCGPRDVARGSFAKPSMHGISQIYHGFRAMNADSRLAIISASVSLLLWSIAGVQFYLICKMLGAEATPRMVLIGFFGPYLLGVLSSLPLGLGVLDFAIARVLLEFPAVPDALGEPIVILYRLLVTVPIVTFGFVCYLWRASKVCSHVAKA